MSNGPLTYETPANLSGGCNILSDFPADIQQRAEPLRHCQVILDAPWRSQWGGLFDTLGRTLFLKLPNEDEFAVCELQQTRGHRTLLSRVHIIHRRGRLSDLADFWNKIHDMRQAQLIHPEASFEAFLDRLVLPVPSPLNRQRILSIRDRELEVERLGRAVIRPLPESWQMGLSPS